MKLIIISDNGSHHKKFNISRLSIIFLIFIFTMFIILFFKPLNYLKKDTITKHEINLLNKFDSVLLKAARLEAEVKRLNSLGQTIAAKNRIDVNEYFLSKSPAMGGIDNVNNTNFSSSIVTQANLTKSIADLELELELQEERFNAISVAQKSPKPIPITKKATPVFDYSTPVATGYVSSAFGKRRDPINGHRRHHNGIDIAAKKGSKIHTIASGFVTFSGRKGAYGNVVDIHHSDSLKSRYAHLDSINVKKGEVVRKGDVIATMGQTGRATGSHLHLEVWEKNRPVNPDSYIDTALIK